MSIKLVPVFDFKDFTESTTCVIIRNYGKDPSKIIMDFLDKAAFQYCLKNEDIYIVVILPKSIQKTILTIGAFTLKAGKFDIQCGYTHDKCVPVNIDHLKKEYVVIENTLVEIPYNSSLTNIIMDLIIYNQTLPTHSSCIRKPQLSGMCYIKIFRDAVRIYKNYKNTTLISKKDNVHYVRVVSNCEICKSYYARDDKKKHFYDLGKKHRYDLLLNIDSEWDYDLFLYGWLENMDIKNSSTYDWNEFLEIMDILTLANTSNPDQDTIDLCAHIAFKKYINNYEFLCNILKRNPSNKEMLLLVAIDQSNDKIIKYMVKKHIATLRNTCMYVISTTIFMHDLKNLTGEKDTKITKYANTILGKIVGDPFVIEFIKSVK